MSDTTYDSRPDTWTHIHEVRTRLMQVVSLLLRRAHQHDQSKLSEPELSVFNEYTPKLADSTYGSDEYKSFLAGMGEGLRHHYSVNSHHPEWGEREIEWRAVGSAPDYEVSSLGDVRSTTRTVERDGPRGNCEVRGRLLKANVTPKGYARLQLRVDGRGKNVLVHRLVAEAFMGKAPSPDHQVNHINGMKLDNRVENLEWVTASENLTHAYETGLREPAVKYAVSCVEEDVVTLGTERMAKLLVERGHAVTSSGIYGAMMREGSHAGLTFEGSLLMEHQRSRLHAMDLLDLMEMLADWKAATMRHADGDLARSIRQNAERFEYSEDITTLLINTARNLEWVGKP